MPVVIPEPPKPTTEELLGEILAELKKSNEEKPKKTSKTKIEEE